MTGQKETLQERLRKKADDCAIFDDAEDATDLSNIAHEAASALDAAQARIKELEKALEQIKAIKPENIGDSGFITGPLAHFQAAQRIARTALKGAQRNG